MQLNSVYESVFFNQELADLIYHNCDNLQTSYALRGTCHALNVTGKNSLRTQERLIELASHKVFNKPNLYDDLPPFLQSDKSVILNLLTKKPEKIDSLIPTAPHDEIYLKTALVAAYYSKRDLYDRLKTNTSPSFQRFRQELENSRHIRPPSIKSPLWGILPFVLNSRHADPHSNAGRLANLRPGIECIKNHFDIALIKVRQNGEVLQWLSDKLKDNPCIVEAAVAQDCESIRFASSRLQHDASFIALLIDKYDLPLSGIDPMLHTHPDVLRAVEEVTRREREKLALSKEETK